MRCFLAMKQYRLDGKTALVCGASQGIGAAIAREFSAAGAAVILLARNEAKLDEVLKSLEGKNHQILPCDLSDPVAVAALVDKLRAEPISIFINNSAGPKGGGLAEASSSEFPAAFQIHLLAAHQILQAILPGMKKDNFGRVINILSTSVKAPIANLGVSNTVRGAVAQWSKTLASELGPFGITVNNILPGFTRTDRYEQLKALTAKRMGKTEVEVEKLWLSQIPSGRIGEPQELAAAALFLASPAGSYVNGINLPVDGGRTPGL